MKTGQVDLPLHPGKAPRWLFSRMVKLSKPISEILIMEYGRDEFLKRISNPYFFQSLGCVLGFDWHSSGLTTTLTGALKQAFNEQELGIKIAGGKGKTSRKTPDEIQNIGDKFGISDEKIRNLIKYSKLSAKVDNNLIQDSYNLYHHTFFLSEKSTWAIVQQGMNGNKYARRYHWLSNQIKNFVEEPHSAIISDKHEQSVMDLTSNESKETRKTTLDIIKENPIHLKKYENKKIRLNHEQKQLFEFEKFTMPRRHEIFQVDLGNFKALETAYENQPKDYEELIMTKGMGGKTIRALSLISSIIYGTQLSWKDPAKFSYAHGGKDGIPYPVNRNLYDKDIEILNQALKDAKLGQKEKLSALKRLNHASVTQR
ncbi:MAG: DUF763 domain-containing protein [Nanoarchaeota archaeon]